MKFNAITQILVPVTPLGCHFIIATRILVVQSVKSIKLTLQQFDFDWYNKFCHKKHNHVTVSDKISKICTVLSNEVLKNQ